MTLSSRTWGVRDVVSVSTDRPRGRPVSFRRAARDLQDTVQSFEDRSNRRGRADVHFRIGHAIPGQSKGFFKVLLEGRHQAGGFGHFDHMVGGDDRHPGAVAACEVVDPAAHVPLVSLEFKGPEGISAHGHDDRGKRAVDAFTQVP